MLRSLTDLNTEKPYQISSLKKESTLLRLPSVYLLPAYPQQIQMCQADHNSRRFSPPPLSEESTGVTRGGPRRIVNATKLFNYPWGANTWMPGPLIGGAASCR